MARLAAPTRQVCSPIRSGGPRDAQPRVSNALVVWVLIVIALQSWHHSHSLSWPPADDIVGAGDRFEEGCEGIMESKATVDALVEAEIQAGLDPSRIAIAGFSQGGGMTLFSGLQQKRKLAGLVVMSGYLAGASTIKPTEEGLKTPILHCHGDSDSMVLPEWAEETKRRVLEHGHSGGYTLKTCA